MTSAPELATGRLRLRPLVAADGDAVVALFADPAMSRYFAADFSDPGQARALVTDRVAAALPPGYGHWAVEHAGALIGVASLRRSSTLPGHVAEIGYSVATKHTGHGFATEAVTAILDHAHGVLGLPAVFALVHEDNAASLAVVAHTGFLDVGVRQAFGATHRVLVALPSRRGRLHHVELWVPELSRAERSWGWLLGGLGWREFRRWSAGVSWRLGDTYLVVEQSSAATGPDHERTRPGLNHLALHTGCRADVDRLARGGSGWRPLFADRYPRAGGPEHYAAYLENEDGFEVELVATDTS